MTYETINQTLKGLDDVLGKYITPSADRSLKLIAGMTAGLLIAAGDIGESLERIADALERIAESESKGAELAGILKQYHDDQKEKTE